jgi:hypothetical protein
MKFLKIYFPLFVTLLILIPLVWGRAHWYGDLRLSIGNGETDSYVRSSLAPVFSWKIFAGERLFTTNLIYKMANDPTACPKIAYSFPSSGDEQPREIVPCFDKISLLQNFVAIFAWAFLALVLTRHLNNGVLKVVAASTIVLFGYTPQLAEWESVLGPESLSVTMFTAVFALTIELAFRISRQGSPFASMADKLLLAAWMLVMFLWIFIRDVHLYAVPVTILLLVILIPVKKFRDSRTLNVLIGALVAIFVLGYLSAGDSFRAARYPVVNAIDEYIWPHPARVEFFKQYGMPERDAANYQDWADHNAAKAYGIFLVSHPGFVVATLWEYRDYFEFDFSQAFYPTNDLEYGDVLPFIGKILHLEDLVIYPLSLLLLLFLLIGAVQIRTPERVAWAWLAFWFFGIALVTLLISFMGDVFGTRRHIMPSVEIFRLFVWVFLMPVLDLSLGEKSNA